MTCPERLGLLTVGKTDRVKIEGDARLLGKLVSLADNPNPEFAIMTP
jgi:alkyl sulfatase BDS1-like metallo-beta-lactamase superfamily hydrolase